jgi:hypothetical protein
MRLSVLNVKMLREIHSKMIVEKALAISSCFDYKMASHCTDNADACDKAFTYLGCQ